MPYDMRALEQKYGLPSGILDAISYNESRGNPDAINYNTATGDPSIGKFQFQPKTAAAYGIDPRDPDASALGAAAMLADLKKQYSGDVPHMLAAYNWGSGNLDKNGIEHAPAETRKYINKVTSYMNKNAEKQYADSGQIMNDSGAEASPLFGIEDPDASQPEHPSSNEAFGVDDPEHKEGVKLEEGSLGKGILDRIPLEYLAKHIDALEHPIEAIGKSRLGQAVGSGIDNASDLMGESLSALTGMPYADKIQSPDLAALKEKGLSNISNPEKVGAIEEALFNSPPGKMMGVLSATPPGMLATAGLGAVNEGLESLGVPHQYSTALELLLGGKKAIDNKSAIKEAMAPEGTFELNSKLAQLADAGAAKLSPKVNDAIDKLAAKIPGGKPAITYPESLYKGVGDEKLDLQPSSIESAKDILRTVLEDEHIDPSQVAANLEAALKSGKPLTAIDVATKDNGNGLVTSGKQLLALTRAAVNMPGKGASLAGDVAARGLETSQRIAADFDSALSGSKFYDVKKDAVQRMKESGDLYKTAYQENPSVEHPEIDRILNTPSGKKAFANAVATMQDNRSYVGVSNPDLVEQLALTGEAPTGSGVASGLKMKTLDLVKQELWDLAESQKNPDTGRDTSRSRAIKSQYRDLRNALAESDTTNEIDKKTGKVIPDTGAYSKATKAYSDPARVEKALEKGRDFMKQDPEEIQQFFSDQATSDAEKNAFATGARRALQDRMDNTNDGTNPINKVWRENVKQRLRPLFPDSASFDEFANRMQHEQTMARINGTFNSGSPTAPNLQYQSGISGAAKVAKGIINPSGLAKGILFDQLQGSAKRKASKMSNETATAITRYLTTQDPAVWRDLAETSPKNKLKINVRPSDDLPNIGLPTLGINPWDRTN